MHLSGKQQVENSSGLGQSIALFRRYWCLASASGMLESTSHSREDDNTTVLYCNKYYAVYVPAHCEK